MTTVYSAKDIPHLRRLAAAALGEPGRSDSVEILRALVGIEPGNPDNWYNLAYLEKLSGSYDDAVRSYGTALDLGIARPEEVHVNRAVIFYEHLDRVDDARKDLDAALAKRPDYSLALANLALISEEAGDRGSALALYGHLIRTDPGNVTAQAKFALLSSSAEDSTNRLRTWIAATKEGSPQRAELLFALASLLDGQQNYASAFAAVTEANHIRKALLPPHLRYQREAVEKTVDKIVSFPMHTWQPSSVETQILSVCGMFRSGSTLIEHILSAHSDVAGMGEVDAFPRAMAMHMGDFPNSVVRPTQVAALAEDYVKRLPPHKSRWLIDKRPDNIIFSGVLLSAFPQSKVIITQRQPLDNIVSLFFLDFTEAVSYSVDLDDALHWHSQVKRLASRWLELFPNRVLEVSYDDFVVNPAKQTSSMLNFLGLNHDEACHSAHLQSRIVRTPSAWQVRKEPFTSSSGRWTNYERFLGKQIAAIT